MNSPWWYRKRALVIGAIYLLGFVPYSPHVSVARALGSAGLAAVVLLTFACWLLRVWGSSYLQCSTVWNADSLSDKLVTAGPFSYTRNPLYLGNVLMALGLGGLAPAPGWVFINIANMAFTVMLIRWEERGMRERYGQRFFEYCAQVPQLFPRFAPASAAHGSPSLAQGLRAEIFIGALLAGTVAVVATPLYYGWLAFGLLYLFGITAQTLLARNSAAA